MTGGVEGVIGEHARLLRGAGHDVRLIAGRGDAEIVPEADSRHPAVERLYRALAAGQPDLTAFSELVDLLGTRLAPLLADRDVVIAHNVLTMPFNLPLAAALGQAGKPLVAWTHDIAWINDRYRSFRRSGAPYSMLQGPQPGATYVAVSQTRRHELEALFGNGIPVQTVPNGIDIAAFLDIGEETAALLERAGVIDPDPLILVPQRVTRRKRLELAIEASARLRDRHPRLQLLVSGPLGPHDADNRAYATELSELRARLGMDGAVVFLHELAGADGVHPVSARAVGDLYRLADVALMTSASEGFGLPALEAAAARIPLACPDLDVLVEAGGPGLYLFPVDGGPAAVEAALERALADSRAVDARHVRSRNSWGALLPRIEGAIERAAGHGEGGNG